MSDSTGKVLSAAGTGITDAGGLSTQTEQTQAYDNQLSQSVQQMLDQVVGAGHSSVTVNALLDFDNATTTSHSYTYASGVPPLAVSSQGESYSGNGSASAGVLGAGTPAAAAAPTATRRRLRRATRSPRTTPSARSTRPPSPRPGSVEKLGVSVVLDKAAAGSLDQDQVADLVSSAVGLDTTRGATR